MSAASVSRLAQLRKQAGVRAAEPALGAAQTAQDSAPAASLALAKLPDLTVLGRLRSRVPPRGSTTQTLPGEAIGEGLRLIQRVVDAAPPPVAPVCADPAWSQHPRTLVIDTETTGLSGGSGTMAFLIGAMLWDGRQWHLLQWLLESPGAESLMLDHLQQHLLPGTRLLSYNGASFDLPLLRTRFLLNRKPDPFSACAHADLLHAVRRRYGRLWPDCRQVSAESRLLGRERKDDLPGSEAPAAWQAWLRWRSSATLIQVVKHNERDVIRLGALLTAVDRAYRTLDFADNESLLVIDWMLRVGQGAFLLQHLSQMPDPLAARVLRRVRPGPGVRDALCALLDQSSEVNRLPVSRYQLCRALATRLQSRDARLPRPVLVQPELLVRSTQSAD